MSARNVKDVKQNTKNNTHNKQLSKKEQKKKDKADKRLEKEMAQQRKKEAKIVRKLAKQGKTPKKEKGLFVENTPYSATPSFFSHNGLHASRLKLYINPGTNREMSYIDVIDFIPTRVGDGILVYLVTDEVLTKYDERSRVIRKNARDNKRAVKNVEETDSDSDSDDQTQKKARQYKMMDYNEYEDDLNNNNPLVVYRWSLIIVGTTQEAVDDQIEDLNTSLNQRHSGAMWDVVPGTQLRDFSGLFSELQRDDKNFASTGENYSKLNLLVNSGLRDDAGVPIGVDILSLIPATAYFDFQGSTESQSMIALPKSTTIPRYYDQNRYKQPSAASLLAQYAANQMVLAGHKAHHIVLNDFDYLDDSIYDYPSQTKDIFKTYDVSKVTLNPIEGFGDNEDVINIFERLTYKIKNIVDLLLDLSMTSNQSGQILDTVKKFYEDNDMWRSDADQSASFVRLTGLKSHTVPTMANFVRFFQDEKDVALAENRADKANELEAIQKSLNHALSLYRPVLGRPSTIERSHALQTYYQFNKVGSQQLKHIQLVNLTEYILNNADEGDVVVIHGFDSILTRVSEMITDSVDAAKDRGVRFIYTFDKMRGEDSPKGKMNDMFDMQDKYYNDLDTDMDWSVIGTMLPADLPKLRDAINTNLGEVVEEYLISKNAPNQALFHRQRNSVNNFIQMNFKV